MRPVEALCRKVPSSGVFGSASNWAGERMATGCGASPSASQELTWTGAPPVMRHSSGRPVAMTKVPSVARVDGATAASTASLSMLIATPPQISTWPPRYWWIRWWLFQSSAGTYGLAVLGSPFQCAIHTMSGARKDGLACCATSVVIIDEPLP
jgi:hypothetical protein